MFSHLIKQSFRGSINTPFLHMRIWGLRSEVSKFTQLISGRALLKTISLTSSHSFFPLKHAPYYVKEPGNCILLYEPIFFFPYHLSRSPAKFIWVLAWVVTWKEKNSRPGSALAGKNNLAKSLCLWASISSPTKWIMTLSLFWDCADDQMR